MNYIENLLSDTNTIEKFKRIQGTDNYISSSCFRFWLNNKTEGYDKHWHLDMEMIIPLENDYRVSVGPDVYTLSPGEILIIPPGESHALLENEGGQRLIYILDFSLLSKIKGFSILNTYLSSPVVISENTCPEIYEQELLIILELCRDYCSDDTLRELVIFPKLVHFFSNYAHFRMNVELQNGAINVMSEKQRYQIDKLNTVLTYIDTHYTEDLTLEQAADVAGFSKYHFSRLFKQYAGQNFYEYLCSKRIKSAEGLLLAPSIPITEVALRSGFSSLSTFNRIFKQLKKCTPSRFRQMYTSSQFASVPEGQTLIDIFENKIEQTDCPEEK